MNKTHFLLLVEKYLAPLVGVILLIYLLMALFIAPDLDFGVSAATSKFEWVNPDHPQTGTVLLTGDQLVMIGKIPYSDFRKPFGPGVWTLLTPEKTLPLQVQHDGQVVNVNWQIYPITAGEIRDRILQFAIALVCVVVALVVQFFMRPKNIVWRLLLVVLSLTALWLGTGGNNAQYNLPLARPLYYLSIWLWMPALLHLMWYLPYPLGSLPGRLVNGAYLAACGMAAAQIFSLLPVSIYLPFFAATVLGSIVLLGLHFLRKKPAPISVS